MDGRWRGIDCAGADKRLNNVKDGFWNGCDKLGYFADNRGIRIVAKLRQDWGQGEGIERVGNGRFVLLLVLMLGKGGEMVVDGFRKEMEKVADDAINV